MEAERGHPFGYQTFFTADLRLRDQVLNRHLYSAHILQILDVYRGEIKLVGIYCKSKKQLFVFFCRKHFCLELAVTSITNHV
jgi:hypothetical protein